MKPSAASLPPKTLLLRLVSVSRQMTHKNKSGMTLDNTQQLGIVGGMKSIFSTLAERQTVRETKINARVSVRERAWKNGEQTETTNDVVVDGYCYTPAVSQNWLSQNLATICDIVAGKSENHIGLGQWV